jgi:putative endonuclease
VTVHVRGRRRWSLYLLRTRDNALYTGIALDVAARLALHAEGRGAKSLRGRGPLALVFSVAVGSMPAALRLEHRLKQLSKPQKERVVAAGLPGGWLAAARRARSTGASA